MHPVGGRKLSEEDVNELFGHLDENGDGKLDIAEMAKALGSGLISMPASSESRSTPEQATAKAMADEVKRVAGLGAAEQQQLGTSRPATTARDARAIRCSRCADNGSRSVPTWNIPYVAPVTDSNRCNETSI
jgi:hypothetical protein